MFTGIVQATGRIVKSRRQAGDGARMSRGRRYIRPRAMCASATAWPSPACCLTVVSIDRVRLDFDVSEETLTVHDGVRRGSARDLEKALRLARPAGRASDERSCRRIGYGRGLRAGRHRSPGKLASPDRSTGGAVAVPCAERIDCRRWRQLDDQRGGPLAICRQPDPAHADRHDPRKLAVGGKVNLEVDMMARYVQRMLEVASSG